MPRKGEANVRKGLDNSPIQMPFFGVQWVPENRFRYFLGHLPKLRDVLENESRVRFKIKTVGQMKILFYDTETTGLNYRVNSIHSLSGFIEIDGEVVDEFSYKLRPHPKAKIDATALKIGGVTLEEVLAYPDQSEVFLEFSRKVDKYVDRYDRGDGFFLAGFNNARFDDLFLRMFYNLNGDEFFDAVYWNQPLDVLTLAGQYLKRRRGGMPNFKLKSVAKELGIALDESRLHTAEYDVEITRKIYRIVTGIEDEI
jgi:DNA polymerase-3 subunit epsilon